MLHLIHCLSAGGASQATIAAAANPGVRSRILSLTPSEPGGRSLAAGANLEVIEADGIDHVLAELNAADVVHAHVWNAPELYDVLRAALPPLRMLIWVHVAGRALPQVIAPAIVARADVAVATSTRCFQHIESAGGTCPLAPQLVLPTRDLARFSEISHEHSGTFTVGYVGAIDSNKLATNVIDLCARIAPTNASFLFVGNGRLRKALERQAEALENRHAFRFVGFQEDVRPFLAEIDVFGYPMSENSFASMDIAVIEAMSAGVPAVVKTPDDTFDGIRTGVDGYVVGSDDEYIMRISELAVQSERRKVMARAARASTIDRFSLPRLWQSFDRIYDELLKLPKRPRLALEQTSLPAMRTRGAEALMLAFGSALPALSASFSTDQDVAIAADIEISNAGSDWLAPTTGGLVHYLNRHPTDPWLLFWRALAFAGQGHYVRSLANLDAAVRNRFPDQSRLDLYRDVLLRLCRIRVADPEISRNRFSDYLQERVWRCDAREPN